MTTGRRGYQPVDVEAAAIEHPIFERDWFRSSWFFIGVKGREYRSISDAFRPVADGQRYPADKAMLGDPEKSKGFSRHHVFDEEFRQELFKRARRSW